MAEIIAEPSALSKIIPVSFKINDTDSVTTTRLATKKQFNTTDTDAWLSFTLDGTETTNGEFDLTLINVDENPSSIFHHTSIAFPGIPFHYKLDASEDLTKNEIRHAGRWIGQVIIRLANGDTTTRQFDFAIAGHLLDGKEARVILIEDYNALIATITASKTELEGYNIDYAALIADVDAKEALREQAEIDRAATFAALVDSEMIAQNVETKLTEKEATFAPRMLSLESQLAETNLIADEAIAKANAMASGSPKGVYTTLALLQAAYPTGTTGAYLVTADGNWYYWNATAWTIGGLYQSAGLAKKSVTLDKMAEKSISVFNTTFLKQGKNILSPYTLILGYWLVYNTGALQASADLRYSDEYMKADPSTAYKTGAHSVVYYTSDFTFISGTYPIVAGEFTTPSNCAYIRANVYGTTENYIIKSSEYTAFEKNNRYINNDLDTADKYPFQPFATFKRSNYEAEIRRAIKRIELFGADSTKSYAIEFVQRAFPTYGSGLSIVECDSAGVKVKTVARVQYYTAPSGMDLLSVPEYASSGVSAKAWIDWTQITTGSQYVLNTYQSGGLDQRVFIMPADEVKLKLPPTIPALVGKEINIYFENVVLADNFDNFKLDVVCDIGTHQNERWTSTPTTAGTYPLTLKVIRNGSAIAIATTSIVVKAASVGSGVNKKAIFIGDSTTDWGIYTGELVNLFGAGDVMDLTLLGSRGSGANLHEGRAGWKAINYTTNATAEGLTNAFWNATTSSFDFAYYMAQMGYTGADYVNINLGINDVFGYLDDASLNAEIANVLTRFDTMIASIKAYNANIKIGIAVTIPPSKDQDAFGKNYRSAQTQWRYKRNNFMFVEKLIDKYKSREGELLYLIPINVNLDTVNNMATETVAVNSRNTAQVVRQSNGVHPGNPGFYQEADVIYYWLKSFES